MKKALVILADGFEEIEAAASIDVLRRAGIEVVVAGVDKNFLRGSRGISIGADKILDGGESGFDALILPGGMPGAANLAASDKASSIILRAYSEGKIVAAICASPAVVLAPLGILEGKSATCYPGMQGAFGAKVNYKEDAVVVDGNLITSRGPGSSLAFALKIAEKLAGREIADKVKKGLLL